MALDVARLRERATSTLAGFTTTQKLVMAGAAAGVVAVLLAFVTWSGSTEYGALYSDLSAADASAVVEKLEADGVAYRLEDQGTTVMVPRDAMYDVRLDMAAANLPGGTSAGYALLDEQGITTSEFRQRVDFQRALEGELARTIEAIEGVESATVHLVMPKDDVFASDEQRASGSVLVRTAPGVDVQPQQVQAITNLVSQSVEGLTPEAVTVADARGQVLKAPGTDGVSSTDLNIRHTEEYEASEERRIQQMIEAVAGPGKAMVKVTADLDFDEEARTSETFGPAGPADDAGRPSSLPATESVVSEDYTGTGGGDDGGILGPNTEVQDEAEEVDEDGPTTEYAKDEADRTFANNRTVFEERPAPGRLQGLDVAILVDSAVVDAQQADQILQLATAGLGLDAARGDQITVERMAFDTSSADAARAELEAAEAAERREEMMELLRTIAAVIIVALVLAFAYRSLRRRSDRPAVSLPIDLRELDAIRAELAAATAAASAAEAQALAAAEDLRALPEPEDLFDDLDDDDLELPAAPDEPDPRELAELEVLELMDTQPDEVALLLRSWLADRRSVTR